MRVVVWNCADGFAQKRGALAALQPDIAIVPEVRRKSLEDAEIKSGMASWIGPEGGRGLAIIAAEGWSLKAVESSFSDKWFLPVIACTQNIEIRILAIWTKPSENYTLPTFRAIKKMKSYVAGGASIVAGDFNQNVQWDTGKKKDRFSDIIQLLAELGLVSSWHAYRDEKHGEESEHTLFFQRSKNKAYHIDYVFIDIETRFKCENVSIGSYEDWSNLSDHVPLIVELSPIFHSS